MKRRDFFKYLGIGSVGAALGFGFGKLIKPPGAELIPYLVPPEDIIPGVAAWYSSLCTQCNAGCGILVKIMEGRAKKIEGNPLHPINKGKLCSRGQAGLQALYNPDRIKGPLKRMGNRGSGDFEEISWEEGLSILSKNLSELREGGNAGKLHVLTSKLRGHQDILINEFMGAYGSPNYSQYELFGHENLRLANNLSAGINAIPHYDIGETRYLLSFGADFSSTWLSPVNYSYGYGEMRQGRGSRGKLVQIEPRMSLTGANADEWVPARPGTENALALAISYAILEKGRYKGNDAGNWKELLKGHSPKKIAPLAEVSEEKIYAIADEFAMTRPSLAIGGGNLAGYENGVDALVAVNILNHLAGNIGAKGGVIPNPESPIKGKQASPRAGFTNPLITLKAKASEDEVKTLIVYNTNPLFTAPKVMKMDDALMKVPFMASLSSFMDETTAMADLILPAHTSFEDWGDDFAEPGVGFSVASIMQPVVQPVYNTMGAGDIFIALGKGLGAKQSAGLPQAGFKDYLKDSWKKIYAARGLRSGSFDEFWNDFLAKGVWRPIKEQNINAIKISASRVSRHITAATSNFEGSANEYPFYLMLYPQAGYLDGRGANLPWIQELPDPMTSVVWGTWVEINPVTAKSLGLKEGDMVSIESPYGEVKAPVYLYQGIRPDTVGMPIGQGHTAYGRYAKDRGSNPMELIPFKEGSKKDGELPINSTRVKISRTDAWVKDDTLVKMEGSTRELGRNIVKTMSPEEFQRIEAPAVKEVG